MRYNIEEKKVTESYVMDYAVIKFKFTDGTSVTGLVPGGMKGKPRLEEMIEVNLE